MATQITKRNGTLITIESTVDISGAILKAEESIQMAVNEIGVIATGEALKRFDADGGPILIGGTKWYAKVPEEKYFQTPYGEVKVARYVYERAIGGKTFCPVEHGARMMRNATPRFAKMMAHKLAVKFRLFIYAFKE